MHRALRAPGQCEAGLCCALATSAGSTKKGCSRLLAIAGERQACWKQRLLLVPSPVKCALLSTALTCRCLLLQAILEATQLKDDPQSSVQRVVVTGCMAQRYAGDLSEAIPEADLFVGFQNYDGLPASIREALAAPGGGAARPAKRQRVQVGVLNVAEHHITCALCNLSLRLSSRRSSAPKTPWPF